MDISVFTLGCKTNLYESGQIVTALINKGHNAFLGLKKADLYVLNTCAITKEAERKSRQLVARAKRLNPCAKIVVVGCASEKNAKQFNNIADVTLIKGTAGKTNVADAILQAGTNVERLPTTYEESVFSAQQRTRALVKIQDGCNNFCSYCIVPYLRGRSRSRKIADVVKEVQSASLPETVLIGIDISQFGKDTGESLPQLFTALQGTQTRIRLGSLEAHVVTDELLKSLTHVNFCPHFHLSLQSGSNTVLKRMNRKYLTEEFADDVTKIRRYFPDVAITTDVIVGFCGETEQEFEETCRFVKEIGFADIHVFPFSKREGTVAYGWEDVDSATKTCRATVLGEIKQQLKDNFVNRNVGKIYPVLCEAKHGEMLEGYTPNYIRTYFEGNLPAGTVVNVKIIAPYKDGAKGEIVL